MNETEIREKVRQIIADQSGYEAEQVKDDTKLRGRSDIDDIDLNLDSMDTAELIVFLESEFDIDITNREANTLFAPDCTVKKVADYIVTRKI